MPETKAAKGRPWTRDGSILTTKDMIACESCRRPFVYDTDSERPPATCPECDSGPFGTWWVEIADFGW